MCLTGWLIGSIWPGNTSWMGNPSTNFMFLYPVFLACLLLKPYDVVKEKPRKVLVNFQAVIFKGYWRINPIADRFLQLLHDDYVVEFVNKVFNSYEWMKIWSGFVYESRSTLSEASWRITGTLYVRNKGKLLSYVTSCVCEGNACPVGQLHCPSSSLLITPLPPCGLRCLQTSVLLDWVIAERNLLSVGKDRFCNTRDIQVKKKQQMPLRCMQGFMVPLQSLLQLLISHIIIPLNTFWVFFVCFFLKYCALLQNCSWPLTFNCLCGLLKMLTVPAAQKQCCIIQMTAAFVEFGLCGDTLDLMLFFPLLFLFSYWQYDHLYNRSFFFFPPLAMCGLCVNERNLQVTPGSKAAQGDLCPGDIILAINGDSTELMTHMEAQNRIKTCTQQLTLIVTR